MSVISSSSVHERAKKHSFIKSVHYKINLDRLEQKAENEAHKKKKEELFRKDGRDEEQSPAKIEQQRPAFWRMVWRFKSM